MIDELGDVHLTPHQKTKKLKNEKHEAVNNPMAWGLFTRYLVYSKQHQNDHGTLNPRRYWVEEPGHFPKSLQQNILPLW